MTKIDRNGKRERLLAKGTPLLTGIPIAILVDSTTACGAEIMASALREALAAPIVGGHTFGKGSVQSVEELPNHYAYKFTIAGFETASGKPIDGVGLEPDLPVEMGKGVSQEGTWHWLHPEARLKSDHPLRGALTLLSVKIGK